jgi:hypothetical protein
MIDFAIDIAAIVPDNTKTDLCSFPVIIFTDFRDGNVEFVLRPFQYPTQDPSFFLQRPAFNNQQLYDA